MVFAVRIVGHFFFNNFDSELFLHNLNNLISFSWQISETVGKNLFSFNLDSTGALLLCESIISQSRTGVLAETITT